MRKRLIILSDLWGREKSDWLINYTQILETNFDIEYYDSCELAEINKSDYTQENLHRQFVNGGIEKAVEKLIEIEKDTVTILAFSIGGVIAWKLGIKSDKIDSLVCVSSTRLRNETNRPKGKITLYFGNNDEFKPGTEWFHNMKLNYEILSEKGHQIYVERQFAEQLSKKMIGINKTTPQH